MIPVSDHVQNFNRAAAGLVYNCLFAAIGFIIFIWGYHVKSTIKTRKSLNSLFWV